MDTRPKMGTQEIPEELGETLREAWGNGWENARNCRIFLPLQ